MRRWRFYNSYERRGTRLREIENRNRDIGFLVRYTKWNVKHYLSLICNLSLLTPPRCKNIKKISCELWKISIAWMLIAQEDYCCAERTEIELLMFLLDMGNAIYFLSGIVLNSVIVINESYVIDLSFVFDQKRIHSPLILWWRNNKKFKTGELKYYSFINQNFWKFRKSQKIHIYI